MVERNICPIFFLSFKTAAVCSLQKPDLKLLDFYLWRHLKDNVYDPKRVTTEQTNSAIRREMRKITPAVCVNDLQIFKTKLDVVLASKNFVH